MTITKVNYPPEALSFDIAGLSTATGIGRTTLYAALKSGALHARKIGNKNIIEKAEALRWISTLPSPRKFPKCWDGGDAA